MLLQEREQHRRRGAARERAEAVVLGEVGVVAHRLDEDRPLLASRRELADRRALHVQPRGAAHHALDVGPDARVLHHRRERGDRPDVHADRRIRRWAVRVEQPLLQRPLPPRVGEAQRAALRRDEPVVHGLLEPRRPPRAGAPPFGIRDRRGPALRLVRVQRLEKPPLLRLAGRRALAGERREVELAREEGGIHLPRGREVEGAQVVEELRLPARRRDALSLVEAVEPVGHDDVAERHLSRIARADAAHGEARRIELGQKLLPPDRRRALARLADPRGGHRERSAAGARKIAPVVAEAAEIPQRAPAPGAAVALREHALEFVLERRDHEHVDRPSIGRRAGVGASPALALRFRVVVLRPRHEQHRAAGARGTAIDRGRTAIDRGRRG
ncbi:hypothetical protein WME74_07980 [Sorangium sp. So ce341]